MIVSKDEFYIPAFCFEMRCKGKSIIRAKRIFSFMDYNFSHQSIEMQSWQ